MGWWARFFMWGTPMLAHTALPRRYCRWQYAALLLCALASGCTPAPSARSQVQGAVQGTVDRFVAAVSAHDADAVYALLPPVWRVKFTKGEFSSFFGQNYDMFVEFSTRLLDNSEVLGVSAQLEGDPCGLTAWEADADGNFKLRRVPLPVPHTARQDLLQAMRSRQFMAVLDEYAAGHPEWDGQALRHLRRVLEFGDIGAENVEFYARDAVVTVPDTAILYLTCSPDGWRIVQCSAFR